MMPDVGAGPACVVGALAPYNHGVPLAGAVGEGGVGERSQDVCEMSDFELHDR